MIFQTWKFEVFIKNNKDPNIAPKNTVIKEINNVYTAYVGTDINNATVKITAKDTENTITLADFTEEKATIESQLDVLRLKHQVEIKEKFGINVGGFGKGMKGQGQGKGMNR